MTEPTAAEKLIATLEQSLAAADQLIASQRRQIEAQERIERELRISMAKLLDALAQVSPNPFPPDLSAGARGDGERPGSGAE